ncbi:MAG: MATE family efflux transporter [Clostridia bacterium]|nr:MATE family efflux transporter [Clostridia bacterium]
MNKDKSILAGNVYKALVVLAVPIMLNNLLQTIYNLTDTFWLGRLGAEHMAAITLVSPLQSFITSFGGGLTAGGTVILSHDFGAGHKDKCRHTANQIFILMMAFSVLAAAILFFGCSPILRGMGAEGNVFTYAAQYQRIMAADIPLIYMTSLYNIVHNAAGKTGKPLALNLIGIIVNMVLDPLFIVVFGWGASGAALATVLAKLPCAVIAMALLTRKKADIRILPFKVKPNLKNIAKIAKVGFPMAIGNSAMQFGFVLMSKSVMAYGTTAVAAYGIGNKINGLVSTPSSAMSNAVSIMSGQSKGANMRERGISAMRAGIIMMVALLAVTGFVISRVPVATALAGFFSSDKTVIPDTVNFLGVMAAMAWTNGVYDSAKGYLNGQGRTVSTVTINALRIWAFRFAILFICQHLIGMGVESIWYAVTYSNAVASVVMGIYVVIAIRIDGRKKTA